MKPNRIAAAATALALLAPWPSANTAEHVSEPITPSGHVVEEVRPVTGFSALRLVGPINVRLKAAERESVTVRADDSLLPYIETVVVPGPSPTLQIGLSKDITWRARRAPTVVVEFIAMNELTVRGSGDLRADRIEGDQLAVSLSGSGDVRIDAVRVDALAVVMAGSGDFRAGGRADQQGYRLAGSGDVLASGLQGRVVKVAVAGSGQASVHATESLEADISGSGDVRFRGEPRITQRIVGSGSVRRAR